MSKLYGNMRLFEGIRDLIEKARNGDMNAGNMALAQSLMVIEKGWDRDFLTSVNLEAEKYGISPVKVKVPKKKEEEKGEVLAPVEKKQGESIPEAHDVTQINEEGKSPKE